ncbi:MAG: hypothetical protein HYS18_06810 [Burkholderiales bacterium]|nr:hypothetical protein [Burkholderiales bacterium]
MNRMPLLASFALFVLLCASIAFWGMQMFRPQARAVAPAPQAGKPEVRLDSVAALFGGKPAAVAVASNFQLKGVVMSGTPGESVAILSADGKPAQTARVNKEVMPGVVVKEVHPTYVMLSDGGVNKRVELPEGAKGQGGLGAAPAPMPSQGIVPGAPGSMGGEPQPLNAPPPPMPGNPMPGIPGPGTPVNPGANPMAPAMPNTPPVMGGAMLGQPAPPNNGVIQVPPPAQR